MPGNDLPLHQDLSSPPPVAARLPLTELDEESLAGRLATMGARKFHTGQILTWLYKRRVSSYDQMTDLSLALRKQLELEVPFSTGSCVTGIETAPDGTQKVAIRLADGNTVEGVIIREAGRITFCISSQVGCAARCKFCRSGLHGLLRNLSRAEIVEEVLHLSAQLRQSERVRNIVFMGIGEPLDNIDALIGALETLRAPWAFEISPRRITVSTVGRLKKIQRLAAAGIPVTLAISLHAGRQATRDMLVQGGPPVAIEELVAEARAYVEATGRNVTFEVVLLAGVNDSIDEARALARLVAGSNLHVNLIPWNPVAEIDLRTPSTSAVRAFADALEAGGVAVTVRKRKGDEISAACGQLASAEFIRGA